MPLYVCMSKLLTSCLHVHLSLCVFYVIMWMCGVCIRLCVLNFYGMTIDSGFQVALWATQLLLPPVVALSTITMLLPPNLDFVYKSWNFMIAKTDSTYMKDDHQFFGYQNELAKIIR